jgi:RHS repeat-associated protein
MTEVWEVTPQESGAEASTVALTSFPGHAEAAYGYLTKYRYDALGNLRMVEQEGKHLGTTITQRRFFAYDALGRLLRVKNPEQGDLSADANFPSLTDSVDGVNNDHWSVGYTYDANGNVAKRKDARNVVTTLKYDHLNRLVMTSYANDPAQTPTAYRHYDGSTNGRGRFWYSDKGVSATGVNAYDAVGRVLEQHQNFLTGANWSAPYSVQFAYNKVGGVTSQIYPSNRTVSYNYDAAGRPGDYNGQAAMSGNLGDAVTRTYASEVRYHELGGMEQERFGTLTPVYDKGLFNSRGQLAEIRVSTYSITSTGHETDWNRGAIINHYSMSGWGASGGGTDNNGNLLRQEVYVPDNDQISSYTNVVQEYGYDSLNRLNAVFDKPFNGAADFYQLYKYDRWGNRTIDPASWQAPAPQFSVDASTNRLGVPAGQTAAMNYDAAGNVVNDSYTGYGDPTGQQPTRSYDAEGRMISARTNTSQTAVYTYDADGRRVRRNDGTGVVWQVYGPGGELLAEYEAGAAPASPRKEYGYRGGKLLVTAEPGDTVWVDDAVPAGASAFGDGDSWNWVTSGPSPYSGSASHQSNLVAGQHQHFFAGATNKLSVAAGEKMFAYVYLDPANVPTEVMLQWNSDDEGWNHRAYWGADQIGWGTNGTGSRRYMGALPAAGGWVRLEVSASLLGLEGKTLNGMAFTLYGGRATWDKGGKSPGGGTGAGVQWLVSDQLGTPRMVIDQTGSLAGVKRHDYLPFGEAVAADVTWRTTGRGYISDTVRQQFTGYERDVETTLDYAQARYFASAQGRFASTDPLLASARPASPQTWNRYAYALNNPVRLTDPTGMDTTDQGQAQNIPPRQPPPPPPPANPQSAPSQDPRPTSVKIDGSQPSAGLNVPTADGRFFQGYGTNLRLTPTDQNGNSIPNVTVREEVNSTLTLNGVVAPTETLQNPAPVASPTGVVPDQVSHGVITPTRVDEGSQSTRDGMRGIVATPTTLTQTQWLFITTPTGRSYFTVYQRTLTNVGADGAVRPYTRLSEGNFTLNRPNSVPVAPMRILCPRF